MRHTFDSLLERLVSGCGGALPLFGIVLATALGCTAAREPGPVRWRELGLRDERGRLPADGRLKALRDREIHLSRWSKKSTNLPTASHWTPQGPFTRGGRAVAMVIHPEDPRILWAATGSGGVWRTGDRGKHWRPLTDHLGYSSGCLVLDPEDPALLYWGSGQYFHNGGEGDGVFVSRDVAMHQALGTPLA